MALTIDTRLTTRDLGYLTTSYPYITIHNNGNPTSDRFGEAAFVQSGGGEQRVLFHGAIDAGGFCQIEKFDRRGVHSGNGVGNAQSIAFEMCIASEPWATVKENTAQLLAAIVQGHDRLDYGRLSPTNYSLDRVVEHRDWGVTVGIGAGVGNPACPARLIQTDGGVETIVARARAIVAGGTPPPPPPLPALVYPDGMDEGITSRAFGVTRGEDKTNYSFDPDDAVSRAWFRVCVKRNSFPKLDAVWVYGDGRRYFVFGHGALILWQANESAPVKVLG